MISDRNNSNKNQVEQFRREKLRIKTQTKNITITVNTKFIAHINRC